MSDTPRTDDFYANPPENEEGYQFARDLERENAKLREDWCDLQWLSSNDVRANFERAYSIYLKGGNTFAGAVRIARAKR